MNAMNFTNFQLFVLKFIFHHIERWRLATIFSFNYLRLKWPHNEIDLRSSTLAEIYRDKREIEFNLKGSKKEFHQWCLKERSLNLNWHVSHLNAIFLNFHLSMRGWKRKFFMARADVKVIKDQKEDDKCRRRRSWNFFSFIAFYFLKGKSFQTNMWKKRKVPLFNPTSAILGSLRMCHKRN